MIVGVKGLYLPVLTKEVNDFRWKAELHIVWIELQGNGWMDSVQAALTLGLVHNIVVKFD